MHVCIARNVSLFQIEGNQAEEYTENGGHVHVHPIPSIPSHIKIHVEVEAVIMKVSTLNEERSNKL